MGKQEVIDLFKCLPYYTSVIYKTISSIIDNNYFQNLENIILPTQLKKKFLIHNSILKVHYFTNTNFKIHLYF